MSEEKECKNSRERKIKTHNRFYLPGASDESQHLTNTTMGVCHSVVKF